MTTWLNVMQPGWLQYMSTSDLKSQHLLLLKVLKKKNLATNQILFTALAVNLDLIILETTWSYLEIKNHKQI